MNKKIIQKIFPEYVGKVEKGICPLCDTKCSSKDFRDLLSLKEFDISGLCQKCQDRFFEIKNKFSTLDKNLK